MNLSFFWDKSVASLEQETRDHEKDQVNLKKNPVDPSRNSLISGLVIWKGQIKQQINGAKDRMKELEDRSK